MSSRRAQQAAIALRLRTSGEGLSLAAIAREMGISVSYASQLLTDPTGEKIRARKRKYLKRCKVCRQLCYGTHCRQHAKHSTGAKPQWSREQIIEAMQEWDNLHGHPPTVSEWLHRDGLPDWCPTSGVVFNRFGKAGWNKAIEAAGFMPRRVGWPEWVVQEQAGAVHPMSPERREELAEEYRELYRTDPDHPMFKGLQAGWEAALERKERRERWFASRQ